jgi:hypothetical protein
VCADPELNPPARIAQTVLITSPTVISSHPPFL